MEDVYKAYGLAYTTGLCKGKLEVKENLFSEVSRESLQRVL